MSKTRWLAVGATVLVMLALAVGWRIKVARGFGGFHVQRDNIFLFESTRGPASETIIPQEIPTSISKYESGSASRLAILVDDPASSWLGLVHGLKTIGVPFTLTRDYRQALQHRVVMVYPRIAGSALSPEALRALADFPRQGGTLIGVDVEGGGLNPVFGFNDTIPSRVHDKIFLADSSLLAANFTDPAERVMLLGERAGGRAGMGSYSYSNPRFPPLAVYDDGSAAVTQRSFGQGAAYAFGIDPGFLILKGYDNREQGKTGTYVNGFEPTIDAMLLLLKSIYLRAEPDAITLGTVPFHRALSVIFTHDIDYTQSVVNAEDYAKYERQQGITATYFMQTKYIKDYNDDVFFNESTLPYLKRLSDLGMELGSHSVSHSREFNKFPMGDGEEEYPAYTPFVMNPQVTYNGTILGELRVSKYLLEHFTPQTDVVSFRPGHLSNPFALPQALAAAGYRYSSSVTANDSLTHLPFQLDYGRETTSEMNEFEFPLTVEDEALPRMGDRLPQALDLAGKIAGYGGCFVILIHPNILDHKFAFEQGFVTAIKDHAWFGSIRQFGDWWSARNEAQWDVLENGPERTVQMDLPRRIDGLSLRTPPGWQLQRSEPEGIATSQPGGEVLLKEAQGKVKLVFATR